MTAPQQRNRERGSRRRDRQRLSLGQYVRRRNGVPLGAPGSLRNMMSRSLGAGSFAGFWKYWNPVFGYALARYVQSPLLRVVPPAVAVVSTFAACGAVHDLVTMAVRGSPTLLFTPWFVLLGIGVVWGRAAGLELSDQPMYIRVMANLTYVGLCLAVTLAVRRFFAIP